MTRQTLIFDADDTLWENNVYFERAFEEFCEYLAHSRLSPPEVRAVLDEIEIVNRELHGYGALNFGRNLSQCYERLCERRIGPDDRARVMAFAERILEQPVELIDGVAETLAELASRHDLMLFTKGTQDEQQMKVDASGLATHFSQIVIVREKNAASYSELVACRGLERKLTWMVGNSPRSDINPALEAGLGAVYVPHPRTWSLEHEEVRANGRLITVERLTDLRRHF
ncbi:MAG TPA: HAD family hydrolase [Bryobacteraceae bacterium]|nr:HAD family hydrolase [Bryobacteraceae bacterium]